MTTAKDEERVQGAELRLRIEELEEEIRGLRQSEARFRALFGASNDAIFLVDGASEEILDVNPVACSMLGYSREELCGSGMSLIHPYEMEDVRSFVGQVQRVGSGWTDELTCLTKSGSFLAAEISASIVELEGKQCLLASVRDVSAREQLERERQYLLEELQSEGANGELVGRSPAIGEVLATVEQVAKTNATVLVHGESGVGKELIARAIHEGSPRRERSLVRVNCAAVPAELFESEFFGHVKGAFTGASSDRVGRFQLADGGTLFLDEVGEIPLALQSKLLRVLQEGTFERIGESHARSVDVRVVAATNRDLATEVRERRFREDLYFRLNVFPIRVPPLRERREDIEPLAQHLTATSAAKLGVPVPQLTPADVRNLEQYAWPGNVRELGNVIERGVILARSGRVQINLGDLGLSDPVPPASGERSVAAPSDVDGMTFEDLRVLERRVIASALEACGGKVYGAEGAAARLGVKPTTLSSKLKKLGIKVSA